ncbi:MAG: type IX secretion system sortase PorU [Bacteroidales bacterium]|nr:type IX secretion system sortase PorU [Bacteroidales bacterium]
MYIKKQYSALIFFVFLAFIPVICLPATGPATIKKFSISWNERRVIQQLETPVESFFTFEGSIFREGFGLLPLFMTSFPADPENDSLAEVKIGNHVYEPVNDADLLLVNDLDKLSADIQLFHQVSITRKKPSLEICLLPLRRNPATGRVERLISFDIGLRFVEVADGPSQKSVITYAANSVLSTGVWYKFATGSKGIYRLTYDDLKNSGVAVGQIDPRKLRIYGNGGGMLPEANAAERIDDLMENTIFVAGEEDGRFDPGDYILFYGQSPDRWDYNKTDNLFQCRKNIYSDRMYYFLNFDIGPGKRIASEPSVTETPTFYAGKFEDYASYEKDDVNLIKTGREWWDRQNFDITTERNYSFNFPNIDNQSPVTVKAYVAARSISGNTSFVISAQGIPIMTLDINRVIEGFENVFANIKTGTATFTTASPLIEMKLKYNKFSSSSVGYLNYLEINAMRSLAMNGSQMSFRCAAGTATDGVTQFTMNGNSQNLQIWDVTNGGDVRLIETSRSGSNYLFRLPTDVLREFIAFDGSSFNLPEFKGLVENQNLHGMDIADYLIICHPLFLAEAQRLAVFHQTNSGLSVAIITPDKIYNEFSSGAQDISAIRDFVRMLYNKAEPGNEPRYLLLFGDASYDFKNRIANNTNFIPSYESGESLSPVSSFVSDDFFGLLDPNEGQSANGTLDIGIGRFPVYNLQQAKVAVDKVINYCSQNEGVKNDWRNVVTFVGDDQNEGGNLFINDSEDLARIIENSHKKYNVDKIYSDAYPMIATPGGARYPEVNEAINKRVSKGTLIMNYVGHGGEVGWAHERILEVPDIKNWRNYNNLSVFVTATCEFSRYDDPGRVSAGEWAFLNDQGGGIALFTTSRLTFAGTNKSLLVKFYNNLFKKSGGSYLKLGDLLVAAKLGMGNSPNIHAFVLLGDPAMQMAYPDLDVVTTSVNGHDPSIVSDTLKALSEVTITGEILELSGDRAVNFSGTIFPTVYDKESEIWTKANYGEYPPVQFFLRKNPVYKGQVEVTNGTFSFSFVVPKDIAYKVGLGKISYYARSAETDANGYDDLIKVGGYNNEAMDDDEGPHIALYMNDRNFRSGGITNQNPDLLVDVSDLSGVNTVGNGIGHDITAVLDGKSTTPMILNDYYVSDLNTFKSGEISYPLSTLSDGSHQITVKVWDVHNNSSEASIEFIVVSSAEFALQHLLNYPNPMKDQTTFTWETNQINQPVEVEIRIFTLNGNPVKTLRQNFYSQGYRSASVKWDGTQDDGRKISTGMYVYSVQLMIPDGTVKRQTSKLVVIR